MSLADLLLENPDTFYDEEYDIFARMADKDGLAFGFVGSRLCFDTEPGADHFDLFHKLCQARIDVPRMDLAPAGRIWLNPLIPPEHRDDVDAVMSFYHAPSRSHVDKILTNWSLDPTKTRLQVMDSKPRFVSDMKFAKEPKPLSAEEEAQLRAEIQAIQHVDPSVQKSRKFGFGTDRVGELSQKAGYSTPAAFNYDRHAYRESFLQLFEGR